jgi:hypothetical protein
MLRFRSARVRLSVLAVPNGVLVGSIVPICVRNNQISGGILHNCRAIAYRDLFGHVLDVNHGLLSVELLRVHGVPQPDGLCFLSYSNEIGDVRCW